MRIIGFIIALVFALAAFWLAYNLLGDKGEKEQIIVESGDPAYKLVDVLVAAEPIDLGDVIVSDNLEAKQWPSHLVVDGFAVTAEQSAAVIGQVARSTIAVGEPINMNRLSNPADPNFIAANLPAGMRMMTVSSDAIAGLAGFMYPGDRVDVTVTHKFPLTREQAADSGRRETSVTETLMTNVKVLAVNQRATLSEEEDDKGRGSKSKLPSSVSLELTPEQAHQLRLAQETGYIALVLRSLEDKSIMDDMPLVITESDITLTDDQNKLTGDEEKTKKTDTVSVVRGVSQTEKEVPLSMADESFDDDGMNQQYDDELGE